MSLARHPQLHVRLPAWRSRLLLVLVLASLAVLAGRAFYLQGLHHNFLQQKGESRHMRVLEVSANRGIRGECFPARCEPAGQSSPRSRCRPS